ncbi:MAG: hydantoinase B/oxoprolinase family protein, partial [Candidatus Aminicenantes bacterium]
RSAYSTNIKERRDCSCALFNPKGNLVALAENIPIHLGSMQGLIHKISSEPPRWNLKPGDIIVANDPFLGGGSHLPDVTLIKPVFIRNRLVDFVANIAHWTDVGGRAAGVGTAADSTEIFQEGMRIPPTKIVKKNIMDTDVTELMMSNMRNRKEREGDLLAQISSLHLGEKRLKELFREYGESKIQSITEDIFNYSEHWLRKALKAIPEGTYSFTDMMDDDGISNAKLPVKVSAILTYKPKPNITFDFSGTSCQARGGINMVFQALLATVNYAVKAIIAPDVPINEGFHRPIRINAPEGSLVNASAPAAVGGRTDTCQRVVDTIMGALSTAVPDRITAASNGATTAIIFAGTESLSGADFVYIEALGGGMGAHSSKDGMDGVQVHITNTANLPIEALEMAYPLRVLRYELIPDSGGSGHFRGGLGILKEIQALVPVLFSAHSDRHRLFPWGIKGGLPGKPGRFTLHSSGHEPLRIPSKVSGVKILKNEILRVQTAGGGGYGSPLKRHPDTVQKDFLRRKISRAQARKQYGVVFSRSGEIEKTLTESIRKEMK